MGLQSPGEGTELADSFAEFYRDPSLRVSGNLKFPHNWRLKIPQVRASTIDPGGADGQLWEEWMELHEMYQQGMSQSEIARRLGLIARRYGSICTGRPSPTVPGHRAPGSWILTAAICESGGSRGCTTPISSSGRSRNGAIPVATPRSAGWWPACARKPGNELSCGLKTQPGEQSQFDWSHFGNWQGHRLYGFALTLGYSRMRYVEFTPRQDLETLLTCLVHAFHYLGRGQRG